MAGSALCHLQAGQGVARLSGASAVDKILKLRINMILVDKALEQRQQSGNPVRVALVGAGYSGRNISYQIIKSFPSMRLVAISNRHIDAAIAAYANAGITDVQAVTSPDQLSAFIRDGRFAVSEDANVLC